MIWFNNVRLNQACLNYEMLIEKAKHFGGQLNVTDYSHFFEKILCCFDRFDNPENSIIRNFSREPKGPDYRDMTVEMAE